MAVRHRPARPARPRSAAARSSEAPASASALLEQLDRPQATAEPQEDWLDGVDEALSDLPEGQRQAIQLRVLDDLSYEEVATALDTTPLGARVRVSRGLSALRRRITNVEVIR